MSVVATIVAEGVDDSHNDSVNRTNQCDHAFLSVDRDHSKVRRSSNFLSPCSNYVRCSQRSCFQFGAAYIILVIVGTFFMRRCALSASLTRQHHLQLLSQEQQQLSRFHSPLGPIVPVRNLAPSSPTAECKKADLSRVMFNILSSAKSYKRVVDFLPLWWHEGLTAMVWVDDLPTPPPPTDANPEVHIPDWLRVRTGISTARDLPWWNYTKRDYHTRLAWTIVDAFKTWQRHHAKRAANSASGSDDIPGLGGDVDWFMVIDDDTVVFTDNLATILAKYDPNDLIYIGNWSEDQSLLHQHSVMAFGGGGYVISRALAAVFSRTMADCLPRHNYLYGQDARISACAEELGVRLLREEGFHQLDMVGDVRGLLEAHPRAPVISLHHLQLLKTVFPGLAVMTALAKLMASSHVLGTLFLQQFTAVDTTHAWSFAMSHGYSFRWYPKLIYPPTLQRTEVTFTRIYGGKMTGSKDWTMDTRTVTPPCRDYALFYWIDPFEREGSDLIDKDKGLSWQHYRRYREDGFCANTTFLPEVGEVMVLVEPGVGLNWTPSMERRETTVVPIPPLPDAVVSSDNPSEAVEMMLYGVFSSLRVRFIVSPVVLPPPSSDAQQSEDQQPFPIATTSAELLTSFDRFRQL